MSEMNPLDKTEPQKMKSKGARIFQMLLGRLHRSRLKAFNMIDKNLWLFGQEKNLSALMTEANGREANNVSQRPCAQSKIHQTKMLVKVVIMLKAMAFMNLSTKNSNHGRKSVRRSQNVS